MSFEKVTTDEKPLETEQKTDTPVVATEPTADEARARRMGWRPESEYRGSPNAWLPADAFLEKVQSEVPVLRERNRYLDDRIQSQERRQADLEATIKEQGEALREMLVRTRTADARTFEDKRNDIKRRMREATANADVAAHAAAEAELDTLDRQRTAPAPAQQQERPRPAVQEQPAPQPQVSGSVQQWIRENPWFNDPALGHLNALAVTLHGQNLQSRMSETDSLDAVRSEIERRFPEHFENARRSAAPAVRTPAAAGGKKPTGKTVHDLPQEAKDALARLKRLIPGYKDEEYLKDYQWS